MFPSLSLSDSLSNSLSSPINPIQPTLRTRTYKLYKDDNYLVPSKGLLKSWRFKNSTSIVLFVDEEKVPFEFSDGYVSITKLRNYIRAIDAPYSSTEVYLDKLEDKFYYHQIFARKYYPTLTNQDLFDAVFTEDIKISFSFPDNPARIEVEEEFWDRKGEYIEEDKEMQEEVEKYLDEVRRQGKK